MLGRRLTTGLLVAWTLAMGAWLVAYQGADATCGPEIYRNCQIGLKVTPGLGRPGIVLLWSLGVVALAMTWLTSRPGSKAMRRTERLYRGSRTHAPAAASDAGRPRLRRLAMPVSLSDAAALSLVVVSVAGVVGLVASTPPREPTPARIAGVRVGVLSSVLRTTVPASGRREPARLTVRLRLTNPGERAILIKPVLVVAAAGGAEPFTTIASPAQSIPPRFSVIDTVRFKTAGAATEGLLTFRRAHLRLDGQTLPLHVTVRQTLRRPRAAVQGRRARAARRRPPVSSRRRPATTPPRRVRDPRQRRAVPAPPRRAATPRPTRNVSPPPRRTLPLPPPPRRTRPQSPPRRPAPAAPRVEFDDSG